MSSYQRMARTGSASLREHLSVRVILSYVLDWIALGAAAGISYVLGHIEPNKRHFSLVDPNIAFPFTEHETVPAWLLFVLCAVFPAASIVVVTLIFVPGSTVPKNTPQSLIWKRKLWEMHIGLLGLFMAVVTSWFFISGMKNMFGKPRPDMLSRCEPDIDNAADYIVGGFKKFAGESHIGILYSADICKQTDKYKLDDGFRSYPSGHASTSAAGLIYLSLFFASKFAVTIPFVVPGTVQPGSASHAAFPSRLQGLHDDHSMASSPLQGKASERAALHNKQVQSLRRQAAAPPVYLLIIALVPFCVSIFVSASRWFNFRHHGFDILFGFIIGIITAIFSFRYYHLPIQAGAGWAWAPRSKERAFWAGVGRLGYAGNNSDFQERPAAYDIGESADVEAHPGGAAGMPGTVNMRNGGTGGAPFHDVELQRMEDARA